MPQLDRLAARVAESFHFAPEWLPQNIHGSLLRERMMDLSLLGALCLSSTVQ